MKNTMTRAHEIRKEAAKKWNCKISEIVFSICLEMAWSEKMEPKQLKKAKRYTVTENLENMDTVRVTITSDFNYTLRKIKGIDGRTYDADSKTWLIPSEKWEWNLSEIAN